MWRCGTMLEASLVAPTIRRWPGTPSNGRCRAIPSTGSLSKLCSRYGHCIAASAALCSAPAHHTRVCVEPLVERPIHFLHMWVHARPPPRQVVFEIGDQAGCRRICKQLLQLDPGHTSALALLGQLASVPDLTCENSLPAELRTKRKWKGALSPLHAPARQQLIHSPFRSRPTYRATALLL